MLQLLATSTGTNANTNAFDTLLNEIFASPDIQMFIASILAILPLIIILVIIQAIFVFFQPFYFRSMKKSQKRIAEAQEDLYKMEKQRYLNEVEILRTEKEKLELEKQKFELEKARLESQGIKVITTNKELLFIL